MAALQPPTVAHLKGDRSPAGGVCPGRKSVTNLKAEWRYQPFLPPDLVM
jgi:hypothetical protein